MNGQLPGDSLQMRALYILGEGGYGRIYGPRERADIAGLVDVYAELQTPESIAAAPEVLAPAEVMLSGWGAPRLDSAFLEAAPNLKLVLYGAGSLRRVVTEAFWASGIPISSAAAANADFTGDFACAQILMGLKGAWRYALRLREQGVWSREPVAAGLYGSVVGLVSLGLVAQRVARLLQRHDLKVIAWDPWVDRAVAERMGVTLMESLDEVFREADVVSLHTPLLDETRGLIGGAQLRAMKPAAVFINTARGALVREAELVQVLRERPDLYALLDVTSPEPPPPESPLRALPNVVLTPHIAGAQGRECRRLGRSMVDELRRFLRGEPLQHVLTRAGYARMA
ncbi:MAG: hydroxyacid dehydrogenase [Anaerolineaceae bacterium]|nr:hydroxyacid dehydrogenase [Anaerolineaceae bacterium]MDE0327982.1 hydroxyacid dehydrogenase [Anaerolineaceae bacterium]